MHDPFDSLPVEVWEGINIFFSTQDQLTLLYVSRTLYRLSRPYIYRHIFYESEVISKYKYHTPMTILDDRSLNPETSLLLHRHGTPIRNCRELLTSLQRDANLIPLIRNVNLVFDDVTGYRMRGDADSAANYKACQNILKLVRPENLHLTTQGYRLTTCLENTSAITSLEVDYPDQESTYFHGNLRGWFYKMFAIPTLTRVCLRNHHGCKSSRSLSYVEDLTKRATSNVTAITIMGSMPLRREFKEVLTWPKKLLHYHQQCTPGRAWYESDDERSINFGGSANLLQSDLISHTGTLKTLHIRNTRGGGSDLFLGSPAVGPDFQEFRSLRALSVPKTFFKRGGRSSDFGTIQNVLPNTLERLYIEMDIDDPQEIPEYLGGSKSFQNWLMQIVEHKKITSSNLHYVVFWQESDCFAGEEVAPLVREVRRGVMLETGIGDIFKLAGIHLEFGFLRNRNTETLELADSSFSTESIKLKRYAFVNNYDSQKSAMIQPRFSC